LVPGQPVLIESPALSEPLRGEVLFLTSEADIQKNTLEVKVAVDSPPEVVKPEMLVDVTFLAPERPEGQQVASEQIRLYVPKQLLQSDGEGTCVWVADLAAGVARRVPVATGRLGTDDMVEIVEGLNVASRLIVGPPEGLRDGQRIHVTGEHPTLGIGGNDT
jgi:multidrug efflux pump subunit AcrA (membrane-fusion protein)